MLSMSPSGATGLTGPESKEVPNVKRTPATPRIPKLLAAFRSGFVRSTPDLDACNKVALAGGLGMVLALAVGWPIWIGFLGAFLPAFVAGGVAHLKHG